MKYAIEGKVYDTEEMKFLDSVSHDHSDLSNGHNDSRDERLYSVGNGQYFLESECSCSLPSDNYRNKGKYALLLDKEKMLEWASGKLSHEVAKSETGYTSVYSWRYMIDKERQRFNDQTEMLKIRFDDNTEFELSLYGDEGLTAERYREEHSVLSLDDEQILDHDFFGSEGSVDFVMWTEKRVYFSVAGGGYCEEVHSFARNPEDGDADVVELIGES